MNKIISRLKQPSTWFGLTGIGVYIITGHSIDPASLSAVAVSLGLVAADA